MGNACVTNCLSVKESDRSSHAPVRLLTRHQMNYETKNPGKLVFSLRYTKIPEVRSRYVARRFHRNELVSPYDAPPERGSNRVIGGHYQPRKEVQTPSIGRSLAAREKVRDFVRDERRHMKSSPAQVGGEKNRNRAERTRKELKNR